MCQQWPGHCYCEREHCWGYSEHPLSVYSRWGETIGTSGPRFSLWPTRERWAITIWIGAWLNYAAASPTRLSGVQQPLWAPGNRCSQIREEDVILCVSVLSKCVFSYCKYGVCYISSCFPSPFRPVWIGWRLHELLEASARCIYTAHCCRISQTRLFVLSFKTITEGPLNALQLNCAMQYQEGSPPLMECKVWSVKMRDVSEAAVILQSGVGRNGKVA